MMSSSNHNNGSQFGDTTLTKVFVGGLAWETPKDTLREHFQKYGEILEAVIISDKVTGRSKGYGFVTFKEAEAANKACEEPTVMINGRRANCNIASHGARRQRSSPATPPLSPPPVPPPYTPATKNCESQQVQWYYPVGTPTPAPPSPFHHHAIPFYGYTPTTYIAPDHMNYNYYNYNYNYNHNQVNYGMGGMYVYPARQGVVPVMHPFYRTEAMGVPAPQIFHPLPPHYSPSITPTTATITGPVGTGECFKRVVV
ncbi:unnamed protein product [Lathyrus oleraceus]